MSNLRQAKDSLRTRDQILWDTLAFLRARALSPALKIATMALALATKDEKHRDWKQINLWKMLGFIF